MDACEGMGEKDQICGVLLAGIAARDGKWS